MFKIADFGGSPFVQKKNNQGQIKAEFTIKGDQIFAHTPNYIAPEFFEFLLEQKQSYAYDI